MNIQFMNKVLLIVFLLAFSLIQVPYIYASEASSSSASQPDEDKKQQRKHEMQSKYQEMIVQFREFKNLKRNIKNF